jgi:hypothetical protein
LNQETMFLYMIFVVFGVSVFSAVLLFVRRAMRQKNAPAFDYKQTHKFQYHKKEASTNISSGISGLQSATSLYSINENLVKAHSGLDFFDAHGVEFASKSPQEIREVLQDISLKKIKRLYGFYN